MIDTLHELIDSTKQNICIAGEMLCKTVAQMQIQSQSTNERINVLVHAAPIS